MAEKALATIHTTEVDLFTDERVAMMRAKYANGAPQDEFNHFLMFCQTRQLDPLQRQVYLIPRKSQGKDVWTIQTSIDGYRAIADRTGAYAGSDDAALEYKNNVLMAATVTVWKMVQGVRCPFTATARWTEYKGNSPLWSTMPATMLSKCAESLALRKAFPSQLSGLYTSEEMAQADRDSAPINGATVTPIDARVEMVDESTGEILEEPASDEQKNFLRGLTKNLGHIFTGMDGAAHHDDVWLDEQCREFVGYKLDGLSKNDATRLIDDFKSRLKDGHGNGSAHDEREAKAVANDVAETYSWTQIYKEARKHGINSKAELETFIGQPINPLEPEFVLTEFRKVLEQTR